MFREQHALLHPEEGSWSLLVATPKPGAEGGYWDNAYHFGDRSKGVGSTVTLFPILQPIAIFFLTALSAILSIIMLYLVFRRTPEQSTRKKMSSDAKG